MRRTRLLLALLLAPALTGCPGGAPTGTRPSGRPVVGPGVRPGTAPTPAVPTPTGGQPASPGLPGASPAPGPGIAASPGATTAPGLAAATLHGLVSAPATLLANNGAGIVANNGGGLITDNGAGIVANNGSGYRLRALPEQRPVAGVEVWLEDAAGARVATTTSGPDGRYAFAAALPAKNLVLRVALPAARGELVAIAPQVAGAARVADLDLVSTLASAYVLEKYVRAQAVDRQTTLDKLPADVEAETRRVTGEALAAGGLAAFEALTPVTIVSTVEALRKQAPALDAQLETVKRLLVLAGQADLGAGRPALDVPLGNLAGVAALPDGTLVIGPRQEGRIWKVGVDGRLVTLAGKGAFAPGDLAGKPATEAGLDKLKGLTADARGRVLFIEYGSNGRDGAYRIEADGTLTAFGVAGIGAPDALLAGVGDEVLAIDDDKVYALAAGQPPTFLRAVPAGLPRSGNWGVDPQGRLHAASFDKPEGAVWRFEPRGEAPAERLFALEKGVTDSIAMDGHANLLTRTPAGQLRARRPDGTWLDLMQGFPDWFWTSMPVALGADGTAYVCLEWDGTTFLTRGAQDTVHKVAGGALVRVAGAAGTVAGAADDLALRAPRGTGFDAQGRLHVVDGDRVLRIEADGAVTYWLGPKGADRTPTIELALTEPKSIQFDAAGDAYVFDEEPADGRRTHGWVYRVTPAGVVTPRFRAPDGVWMKQAVAAPDGGLLYRTLTNDVRYLAPAATAPTEVPNDGQVLLGLGQGGGFWLLNVSSLRSWSQAAGFGAAIAVPNTYPAGLAGFAVDAGGRAFLADGRDAQLRMLVPATGAYTTLAGAGGTFFTGATADDALKFPMEPCFSPAGDLVFADLTAKLIKKIPAGEY